MHSIDSAFRIHYPAGIRIALEALRKQNKALRKEMEKLRKAIEAKKEKQ